MTTKFSFRTRVLQGLLAFLPLFLTIGVIFFLLDSISQFTRPLVTFAIEQLVGDDLQTRLYSHYQYVSFPISLALSLLLLYGLGFCTQFGLKALTDRLLGKVPGVASVYSSIRQMVDLLSSSDGARSGLFKRVVLIEQSPGVQLLGFMTGVIEDETSGNFKICVYVPMPPNPTSGLIHWVDPGKLVKVEWDADVAMKTLVSGGLLIPSKSRVRALTATDLKELLGADPLVKL